jgi:hypothetical protein
MEIVIIALAAFATSLLIFFSGFGLGTILMPVFALFFPVDLAIALTGVVHFCNNLFKIALVVKNANKTVLIRFRIPAIASAFIGAWLLIKLSGLPSLYQYQTGTHLHSITPVKAIIAVLLIMFAIIEILPAFKKLEFDKKKLWIGGVLNGFFGGLFGIQGAIRSAFLVKSGLSKEAYIGTAVVLSVFVDITRLSVYTSRYAKTGLSDNISLVISATLAAITGAFIGKNVKKCDA